MNRRQFIESTLGAGIASILAPVFTSAAPPSELRVAPFRIDVSPPLKHPLCGGWIKSTVVVDDPLEAIGFVLLGVGDPIVICAVDWTALLNSAHIQWRQALATAANTTPDRVAVQCVHQHNAPFVCLDAQEIVAAYPDLPKYVETEFFTDCLKRAQAAIKEALKNPRPVTHIATGQAKVEKVASNRRIVDENGKLIDWRGSSSKNSKHWEHPEGLIDPWMKNVAFYNNDEKLVSCYYYATHPMSYYGDGRVNSDFVGMARKLRQADEPGCFHIYFTGCSGNIAAGKYNNGSPEARQELKERIYQAMVACSKTLSPEPVSQVAWQTSSVVFPPNPSLTEESLLQEIANPKNQLAIRMRAGMKLAFLRRCQNQIPIVLSALHVNKATLLHLPGESFVEYQLRAQQAAPGRFVATAAYGDDGPWYIPTTEAFPQGGYEVSVAFSAPAVDELLSTNSSQLVNSAPA
jgi:hypothetical protein